MTTKLTTEEILLGQLYAWIHKRAEYLRSQQKRTVAAHAGQSNDTATVVYTEPKMTRQDHDATPDVVLQLKEVDNACG